MPPPLYPLRFRPVYKDYLWGGDRIIRTYHRPEPPGTYAESWEVSTRPEGMSVVRDGPLAGKTLADLIQIYRERLLGPNVRGERFPLLIKLIDSRECLSVQVHPSDESAAQYGGEAKTEMWYVLAADEGARVFAGLRDGTGPEALTQAVESGAFEPLLESVPVKPGDAVFIPGGRVHAIDAGCLLLEVQQNSNTTYRLYDWGRVGNDGKPRETHVEQALRVIRWDDPEDAKVAPSATVAAAGVALTEVHTCPYFRLQRLDLEQTWAAGPGTGSFQVFFAAEGAADLRAGGATYPLARGDTCFVPAAVEDVTAAPASDVARVLRITVPAP